MPHCAQEPLYGGPIRHQCHLSLALDFLAPSWVGKSLPSLHSYLATLRESHCGLRFPVSRDQLFYIALDPRRICKLRVDGDLGFHCIHGKTISNFQYKIIFSKYNFEFIIIKILLSQIKTKKIILSSI